MIDYHKTHTNEQGEFVISHSNLNNIDPQSGGHPKKFYADLTTIEGDDKKNPSFEKGDLLHSWMQHKESFIVTDETKPTPQISALIDEFFKLYIKEEWKNNAIFLEYIKVVSKIDGDSAIIYQEIFKAIHKREYEDGLELSTLIKCIRFARTEVEYNATHKEATVAKAVKDNLSYLEFLRTSNGMIILSSSMKNTLDNCAESIRQHPFAKKLIFDLEGEHEKELFWKSNGINRKGKLDKIIVLEKEKILIIPDLKTTSYDVSSFAQDNGAYHKYNLGRQLTNYSEGFFLSNPQFSQAEWTIHLFNIVVQTNGNFPTMVYKTNQASYFTYRDNLYDLEKRVKYHIDHNQWNITMEEAINPGNEYIVI